MSRSAELNDIGSVIYCIVNCNLIRSFIQVDSRASLTMSLAQGNYCRIHSYDPEDPRCAHVILTGIVAEVQN